MKTTPFRELKDQYFGAPGTPEREEYEAGLAAEIAELTKVKERPILFSGPMVRTLLDASKTQTRRIVKSEIEHVADGPKNGKWYFRRPDGILNSFETREELAARHCPYGQPGERLWVRETWGEKGRIGFSRGAEVEADWYVYRADGEDAQVKWKPSIHMPRAASRILLEIVSVRVERLQSISEADAATEGYSFRGFYELLDEADQEGFDLMDEDYDEFAARKGFSFQREWFRMLWQDIYGPDLWHTNPWVWVVEFKRVQP